MLKLLGVFTATAVTFLFACKTVDRRSSDLSATRAPNYNNSILQPALLDIRENFSRIVVFGDSLSDEYWLARSTLGVVPNRTYYRGRFSNGPLWTEYLGEGLQIPRLNLATGAATTVDATSLLNQQIPVIGQLTFPKSIDSSVDDHIRSRDFKGDGTLFIIWGGPNDFFGGKIKPEEVATNILVSAEKLLKAGARLLFVPAMFDLSRLPKNVPGTTRPDDTALAEASVKFNQILQKNLESLRLAYPNARVISANPDAMVDRIQRNKAEFDFENTLDACYIGGFQAGTGGEDKIQCSDPDRYAFWDRVHPSTRVHCAIAVEFLTALGSGGIVQGTIDQGALLDACRNVRTR